MLFVFHKIPGDFKINFHCFVAAAAAAAQLGQVPPPEHLSFAMNDMQMPMAAKDKVKRRRKRKGDMMDTGPPPMNSQSSSDEPPLKVVPHHMKYSQSPETGHTDLKVNCYHLLLLLFVQSNHVLPKIQKGHFAYKEVRFCRKAKGSLQVLGRGVSPYLCLEFLD